MKYMFRILTVLMLVAVLVSVLLISAVSAPAPLGETPEAILALDGSVVLVDAVVGVPAFQTNDLAPLAVDTVAPIEVVAVLYMLIATGLVVAVRLIQSRKYTHPSTGHSQKGRAGFPLRDTVIAPFGA